jgi:hypothetical protein
VVPVLKDEKGGSATAGDHEKYVDDGEIVYGEFKTG